MLRASLKELLAYRGRLTATVLAIVLGVGFITGTMVFNDAMRADFYNRFARAERGVDLAVEARSRGGPVGEAQLAAVRGLPGVAAAEPRLSGDVGLLDDGGGGQEAGERPTVAVSVAADQRLRWQEPTSGRLPSADGEVAVDEATAQTRRLRLGDTVRVAAGGREEPFTLVGTVDPGLGRTFVDARVVAVPAAPLGRLLGGNGYDRIDAVAAPGASPARLAELVAGAVGDRYRVSTGDELRRRAAAQVAAELEGFGTMLLLFAVVALLVAAFVIANTFTILVAQRSRQLALLRCLGAARRQVFRAVLGEAAVLGLASSVLGIGAGLAVAAALRELIGLLTEPVATGSFRLTPVTVAAGLGCGLLVTVAAAALPAIRATRVAPVAAMRAQAVAPATRPGKVAGIGGALLLVAGGGLLWVAGATDGAAALLAGGALTFGGLVVFGPHLVGPAGRLLGTVSGAASRVPGRLAVANAVRNPRRTAATTAALMIGVTLLTAFATGAASLKASVLSLMAEQFPVEFVVSARDGSAASGRALNQAMERLRGNQALDVLALQRTGTLDVGGRETPATGVDAGFLDALRRGVLTTRTQGGSLDDLAPGTVAVSARMAADDRLAAGASLALGPGAGQARVLAVYGEADGPRSLMLPLAEHRRLVGDGVETLLVSGADGVASGTARAVLLDAIAGSPELTLADQATYVEELTTAVNSLLGLVGGLLALALLIALLGIANTLALSVVERVRESALLRALGLTRGQLRGMLAVEAVVTALLGGLLGLGLGLLFARAAVATVPAGGLSVFTIPWTQLAAGIAGAVLVGLVASVLPGRAAARTDVVRAMATE